MIEIVQKALVDLKENPNISKLVFRKAQGLYYSGQIQLLTQSKRVYEFAVDDAYDDFEVKLGIEAEQVFSKCSCKSDTFCHHVAGSMVQLLEELHRLEGKEDIPAGKKYTRRGMVKRVMAERQEKANKAEYTVELAGNNYGEHILTNERQIEYKITFRDLKKQVGYCSCPDYRHNKLGTCKHLLFAFAYFKSKRKSKKRSQQPFPFVEVFLDPLKDYRISWYFPHDLDKEVAQLLSKYFGDGKQYLEDDRIFDFLYFMDEAKDFKQIFIRDEVVEKVEKAYNKRALEQVKEEYSIDLSIIKADLFEYQKKGIEFATYRDGAIIADEMGLGKTIQAIGTALMKKQLFDFKRVLVVCPASIKSQWVKEVAKFSDETAIVIEGSAPDRKTQYKESDAYFLVTNYEAVLRDQAIISQYPPDLIILDEAQRIKNYTTSTAAAVKSLPKKHALVITGTPIENRLIDLYSIVDFIDHEMLTPLWEFSYQHCFFDMTKKNKITGYYNLQSLRKRLKDIVIRREKRQVIKQLPQISQIDVPINMHPLQSDYHSDYARGISQLIHKKFLTPFDLQKLMLLLSKMRMVCDSTFLIDGETNVSPKLKELQHILLDKMDIKTTKRKVIIFSEWVKMHMIIGKMLRDNGIGFVELTGKVPVKKRGALIEGFRDNEDCCVLLSTEAGGTGLNLQFADTIINFELPWNPAKKNQRIGRIDRIGQLKDKLTVINLITTRSIETRIASGLILKQNLFEGVLSPGNTTDVLDFTRKGKGQFFSELENAIQDMVDPELEEMEEEIIETKGMLQEVIEDLVEPSEQPEATEEPLPADVSTTETNAPKEGGEKTEELPAEEPIGGDLEKVVAEEEEEPQTGNTAGSNSSGSSTNGSPRRQSAPSPKEVQQVMNQGLGFLAGIFKMATGQDLGAEEQSITVDESTGEVTMKFKIPGMGGD